MHQWRYRTTENGVEREILVVGREPEEDVRTATSAVRLVSASVSGDAPPDDIADFLGFVARIPYEGAEPSRARQWVVEHATRGGKLTLGGANFELLGEDGKRVLRIVATRTSEP